MRTHMVDVEHRTHALISVCVYPRNDRSLNIRDLLIATLECTACNRLLGQNTKPDVLRVGITALYSLPRQHLNIIFLILTVKKCDGTQAGSAPTMFM